MNLGLQRYRIRQAIIKKGIAPDLIDVDALLDSKLTYEENKRIILKSLGGTNTTRSVRSTNYYAKALDKHDKRSRRAKREDDRRQAKTQYFSDTLTRSQYQRWAKNPNRYDIKGVDDKSVADPFDYDKPVKRYGPSRGFF